ncbi:hypothetical protein J6590_082215 [Homalodisca vitripennis]|nr:hypothetical protein J6590_082215 [Homalodisca vitripennis]
MCRSRTYLAETCSILGKKQSSNEDLFTYVMKLCINRTYRIYCSRDVFNSRERTPAAPLELKLCINRTYRIYCSRDVFNSRERTPKAAPLELKLYINRTYRIYCSRDVFNSRERTPVSPRCV